MLFLDKLVKPSKVKVGTGSSALLKWQLSLQKVSVKVEMQNKRQ